MVIETILNNQEEEEAQAGREEHKVKNEERTAEYYEAGETVPHHDVLSNTPQFGGDIDWKDISCVDGLGHILDGQSQPTLTSHEIDQPSGRPRQRRPCFGWLSESEEENEAEEPEGEDQSGEPPINSSIVYLDQEMFEFAGSLHHEMKREPPRNASLIYQKQEGVDFSGSPHHEVKQESPSNASIIYQEKESVGFAGSLYCEIKQEQEEVEFAGSLHRGRKRRSGWDVKHSDM
ncbi:uncharacterized protein LOC103704034 isoform X2 [Phoenix dactylifera]|nr:uncharacterized protein LOC103704034 isoform X2 [Phoenix dactylifera]